jgi:hypothetical protein
MCVLQIIFDEQMVSKFKFDKVEFRNLTRNFWRFFSKYFKTFFQTFW